ncbi:hypothetical protein C2E25_06520 [Geothermobacter hydrogeniphilus]|uniref:SGNH hydrolase-type esterase domain-containing protein n=2 Tax=Geothermobacter hydrogeniphilus TaxID=1969733 RepID=A0A2K2HB45_9BACT|nr:hypothetical protein C2E25_06520 [Geothermobacter hydrogeniphilus]
MRSWRAGLFRAWMKNIAALLVGIVLLVLLESLLALLGVPSLSQEDPFVGFAGKSPLFVRDDNVENLFHLNPDKAAYFNQQQFEMPKKKGAFRILVMGGSTTYGRPYLGKTAFGAWLEKLLERYVPGLDVEVINAGGISYASYRLKRLLPELLNYDPDLVVIYAGHNEFLEKRTFDPLIREPEGRRRLRGILHHSRLYSELYRTITKLRHHKGGAGRTVLGEDVEAVLEQVGGPELYHRDSRFREGVIRQYRFTLGDMARMISRRKVPLILCTLPVNLSGVSPFKSEHRAGLRKEEWQQWQAAFEDGEQKSLAGDLTGALNSYRQAERIDDQFAELSYRIGKIYLRRKRFQKAYEEFDRARQNDIVPLRALDEFNVIIRQIAGDRKIPLADIETFFRRISPGGIPGNNLFADHVHPTLEGQQILAWVVLNAATDAGLVPLSAEQWQGSMVDARAYLSSELAKIPERYRARGLWGVGRLYYWAGKYPEAERALKLAWKTVRDEAEIPKQLGSLALWRGAGFEAMQYFVQAEQLDPGDPWIRFGRVQALLMQESGRKALDLLDETTWPDGMKMRLDVARCRALFQAGQDRAAKALLNKLQQVETDVPALEKELADLYVLAGRKQEARMHYLKALRLEHHPAPDAELEQWWNDVGAHQLKKNGNP